LPDNPTPVRKPVDAATLIIIDRSGAVPKVLLGRRHAGHVFMPGKFVFPGGSVEKDDAAMPVAAALHPDIERRLKAQIDPAAAPAPHAIALASIRETFEETGLLLGGKRAEEAAVPAGIWTTFAEAGFYPDLSVLHFINRAITPPGFPRRFDARFFATEIGSVAHKIDGIVHADAELVELTWVTIPDARRLDLPMITHIVLEELEARVAAGLKTSLPVPFYRTIDGQFTRGLLDG
jgi:8-oxo-dGTP pyrophosphatase MutT (NUDIX family)